VNIHGSFQKNFKDHRRILKTAVRVTGGYRKARASYIPRDGY